MSTTMEDKPRKPRRKQRTFTPEFKAEAVRLVVEEGKTASQVARDLDLTHSCLCGWIRQAKTDAGKGPPGALTTAERERLRALEKEVRVLRMERDILSKATAFFAKGSA
jgi:transposase